MNPLLQLFENIIGPRSASRPRTEADLDIDPHLVSLLAPQTFEAEQYWALGQMLEQLHHETQLSVVAVSSPTPGDGKTTVSINLASTLAQLSNSRVLIVETDLRRPRLSHIFGLEPRAGLGDIVKNTRLSLDDVIHHCPPLPYPVLPAGQMVRVSSNALNSPRLGVLFQEARERFDYIIVDTPPMLPFPDCRFIKRWVDGFILLANAHKTPRKLVDESLAIIGPKKLIGLVFNNDNQTSMNYSSYYNSRPTHLRQTGQTGRRTSHSSMPGQKEGRWAAWMNQFAPQNPPRPLHQSRPRKNQEGPTGRKNTSPMRHRRAA